MGYLLWTATLAVMVAVLIPAALSAPVAGLYSMTAPSLYSVRSRSGCHRPPAVREGVAVDGADDVGIAQVAADREHQHLFADGKAMAGAVVPARAVA